MHGAMFMPIGDAGRAELVEKRLADAITGGHLRAGDRLPSEAELARTMGVAPVTVREALMALRSRGLVITRRGRNGGSFVSDEADPLAFARETLVRSSSLAIRDLGVHYAALTSAGARLAARRAAPSEVAAIRARLSRIEPSGTSSGAPHESGAWRQAMDDLHLELVALSQSARLTRDQMRLQAELSPLLLLIDVDPAVRHRQWKQLDRLLDAVEAGDEDAAGATVESLVSEAINAIDGLRLSLHGS
ncbi:hypothetical protein DSM26151_27630 [Agromyces marinus]|uniref:HTH gntR-type domain-containing protein n=2 Tax=Agromyces marinus TaxID=1389020 RepID=A0ABM8H2Q0_9MICO|nr:hypothetical protein DSM26151_27630 [Agromyces marinus]BDZ55065.1 hypothetical protein GCM10025870_21380 [Agromyces marinus]